MSLYYCVTSLTALFAELVEDDDPTMGDIRVLVGFTSREPDTDTMIILTGTHSLHRKARVWKCKITTAISPLVDEIQGTTRRAADIASGNLTVSKTRTSLRFG